MIQRLKYGEPILKAEYVEDEHDYKIDKMAVVINLSFDNNEDILIEKIPLKAMKGTIAGHTTIPHIDKAVVFTNWEDLAGKPDIFAQFAQAWPSMYSIRPEERFKDVPFYHADGEFVHDGMIYIDTNCLAEPRMLGMHQTHARDIDEYHCQMLGYGAMQEFHEKDDVSTKFREMSMAPGVVHDALFDGEGRYPWHQYVAYTPVVFTGIHITRK